MGLEYDDEAEFLSSSFGEISYGERCRSGRLDNYYSVQCCPDACVQRKIYRAYDEKLRRNRLLDFDDMLVYTYELFKEREDIRSAWQKKYPLYFDR